jgi:hypothetical protein
MEFLDLLDKLEPWQIDLLVEYPERLPLWYDYIEKSRKLKLIENRDGVCPSYNPNGFNSLQLSQIFLRSEVIKIERALFRREKKKRNIFQLLLGD